MKKHFLIGLLAFAVVALGFSPLMAAESIKIGGGPTGGTFNTFANAMAVYVPKKLPDIQASAVGSGGSVENVKRVSSGESDFGLCYAVDSALGFTGKLPKDENKYPNLRAVGYLYGAPAQLIVKADSDIKTAYDLKGKRVAVGNAGSGAAASAERFFRHIGCLLGTGGLSQQLGDRSQRAGENPLAGCRYRRPEQRVLQCLCLFPHRYSGRNLRQGYARIKILPGFNHPECQQRSARRSGLQHCQNPVVPARNGGHGDRQKNLQGNDIGKQLQGRFSPLASRRSEILARTR
jgi:hypothetical protein